MKKVLTIFGTRPEAIKLAQVNKELDRHQIRIMAEGPAAVASYAVHTPPTPSHASLLRPYFSQHNLAAGRPWSIIQEK
jgi:hypothetical protein